MPVRGIGWLPPRARLRTDRTGRHRAGSRRCGQNAAGTAPATGGAAGPGGDARGQLIGGAGGQLPTCMAAGSQRVAWERVAAGRAQSVAERSQPEVMPARGKPQPAAAPPFGPQRPVLDAGPADPAGGSAADMGGPIRRVESSLEPIGRAGIAGANRVAEGPTHRVRRRCCGPADLSKRAPGPHGASGGPHSGQGRLRLPIQPAAGPAGSPDSRGVYDEGAGPARFAGDACVAFRKQVWLEKQIGSGGGRPEGSGTQLVAVAPVRTDVPGRRHRADEGVRAKAPAGKARPGRVEGAAGVGPVRLPQQPALAGSERLPAGPHAPARSLPDAHLDPCQPQIEPVGQRGRSLAAAARSPRALPLGCQPEAAARVQPECRPQPGPPSGVVVSGGEIWRARRFEAGGDLAGDLRRGCSSLAICLRL